MYNENDQMRSFQSIASLPSDEYGFKSFDFSDRGDLALAVTNQNSVEIWDVKSAAQVDHRIFEASFDIARFTHTNPSIICGHDSGMQALDYSTGKTALDYKDCKDRITGLELSSVNNTAISTDEGGTLHIWDITVPNPVGKLSAGKPLLAAIDCTSLIFVVACKQTKTISLYDLRNYTREPFLKFECQFKGSWTKLEISNDGKYLLVATDSNCHILYNAFNGEYVSTLTGFKSLPGFSPVAFSMDGRYLYGTDRDSLSVWNLDRNLSAETKPWAHINLPQFTTADSIVFNPSYLMMATIGRSIQFWTPQTQFL